MMDNKLHFMFTSERGETRSFIFSIDKLQLVGIASVFLILGSIVGWFFSYENVSLRHQVSVLNEDLRATISLNQNIQERVARQEKEQKSQLKTALTELRERSEVIKTILNTVGVDLDFAESSENAGGPFAKLPEGSYENLTLLVDQYLDTIHSVPLGVPVIGSVTSRFGRRIDPFNKKPAFHGGIDIKSKLGTKIIAPAAGVVLARGRTRGFGNFVELEHGNSFQTRYLHMQKSLVKRGEKVARGQVIGLVGSSGRSTGSHLHYEVKYRDKLINPVKFMRVGSYMPTTKTVSK